MKTHGQSFTRLYRIWVGMKSRCYNPNATYYQHYGGRGIHVCDEWRDSWPTFEAWAVGAGYDDHLQIERIDNDGPYSPNNCTWTTPKRNTRNRRVTTSLTAFGETKPLADWVDDPRCSVQYETLLRRITRNWDVERAITLPARSYLRK